MPFIRLSDNYINHPKFLALTDGAFRLWHEGMAYARMHQTDGTITFKALKTFQAFTKGREKQLSTPHQPGARPLWELKPALGYTIHDYLDWNPSKEEENERRADSKGRMRQLREQRRTKGVAPVSTNVAETTALARAHDVLGTDTDTGTVLQEKEDRAPKLRHWQGSGAMGADLPRAHLRHTACGRVCLQEQQFARFVAKLGGDPAVARETVRHWAESVLEAWNRPPLATQAIGGNDFQFWDARWLEWQGAATAAVHTDDAMWAAIAKQGPSKRP